MTNPNFIPSYSGQCIGGPRNGQLLVHWAKEHFTYDLMFSAQDVWTQKKDAAVQIVLIGTYYYLSETRTWRWEKAP